MGPDDVESSVGAYTEAAGLSQLGTYLESDFTAVDEPDESFDAV